MIKILTQDLVNKIAAGEVIEGPSSVVKELIENSIDAMANEIVIELKDSGMKMIKVIDNGIGMSEEDCLLCFEKHATSKIADEEDLFNINTLGFRGEALASIAAVSNITILSKQKHSTIGCYVEVEAGKLKKKELRAANSGTTINVKDLFFNTPVRKKHLETYGNELRKIIDIVQRYSLAYPEIAFRLINDGTVLISSPIGDHLTKVVVIYGIDVAKNLIEINYKNEALQITGFISKPAFTRADKSYQSIFVNRRYVQNKEISDAIYDAYHSLLFTQRHPIIILMIELEKHFIDVNVHPQKKEIRFSKDISIYQYVFEAIRQALMKEGLYVEPTEEQNARLVKIDTKVEHEKKAQFSKIQDSKQVYLVDEEKKDDFYILGQLHKCYILVEDKEGLLILDQHVVHERILYEILMKKYMQKSITSQSLIEPVTIELQPSQRVLLNENIDALKDFGIELENFGDNTFLIRSLPVVMGKQMEKEIVFDILDELSVKKVESLDKIKEAIITRMACRSAIKKNDVLTNTVMSMLVRKLQECELPYTCPHGRPITVRYTLKDLDKVFKRV